MLQTNYQFSMELGRGSFGSVKGVGPNAIKSFKSEGTTDGHHNLVTEVFVTRYVSLMSLPNIIHLKGCDFERLTMTTERWNCNLDVAITRGLSSDQKKSIHRCILRGLSHLGMWYIVNADVKPSNILVDSTYMEACIADFGISSSSEAARVRQTSPAFSLPRTLVKNHRSHDMFSFVIVTLHLLYKRPIRKVSSCSELRDAVTSRVPEGKMRRTLLALIREDKASCWTAERALDELYGEKIPRQARYIPICSLQDRVLASKIEKNINVLSERFMFRRRKRCLLCSTSIVSSLSITSTRVALLYSTVMAHIFYCSFSSLQKTRTGERLTKDRVMSHIKELGDCYVESDFFSCLNTILGDDNIIKLMFAP